MSRQSAGKILHLYQKRMEEEQGILGVPLLASPSCSPEKDEWFYDQFGAKRLLGQDLLPAFA